MTATQQTPEQRLEELLNQYWECAFAEGRENRTHDTEDGQAQRTLSELRQLFKTAQGQVSDFIDAAKDAIPAGEYPLEPTPSNWAWQVRMLGADRRALLAEQARLAARNVTFRVFVATMLESHRVTYWTTIVRSDRPTDAKPWDKEGIIHPFMTEELWQAENEAQTWAEFLGVTAEPYEKPDWLDAKLAEFAARAQQAGAVTG